jgi:hypothetical protein
MDSCYEDSKMHRGDSTTDKVFGVEKVLKNNPM